LAFPAPVVAPISGIGPYPETVFSSAPWARSGIFPSVCRSDSLGVEFVFFQKVENIHAFSFCCFSIMEGMEGDGSWRFSSLHYQKRYNPMILFLNFIQQFIYGGYGG
jgi:hypothetical protein